MESGERFVFEDVTAVFIAGVEAEAAADSDNDSNVSKSLFDMEDKNDGEDETQYPCGFKTSSKTILATLTC